MYPCNSTPLPPFSSNDTSSHQSLGQPSRHGDLRLQGSRVIVEGSTVAVRASTSPLPAARDLIGGMHLESCQSSQHLACLPYRVFTIHTPVAIQG